MLSANKVSRRRNAVVGAMFGARVALCWPPTTPTTSFTPVLSAFSTCRTHWPTLGGFAMNRCRALQFPPRGGPPEILPGRATLPPFGRQLVSNKTLIWGTPVTGHRQILGGHVPAEFLGKTAATDTHVMNIPPKEARTKLQLPGHGTRWAYWGAQLQAMKPDLNGFLGR